VKKGEKLGMAVDSKKFLSVICIDYQRVTIYYISKKWGMWVRPVLITRNMSRKKVLYGQPYLGKMGLKLGQIMTTKNSKNSKRVENISKNISTMIEARKNVGLYSKLVFEIKNKLNPNLVMFV